MPVNSRDLLDGIAILADNHNLRVTVKQSTKGAMVCGAICFIGGMVGGPVGLAVGGTLGGITAYRMTASSSKYLTWLMNCLIFGFCVIGGMFCGPIGMLIGLIIGGWMKQHCAQNFRSVGDIIRNDLTSVERERLLEHVVNSVREIGAADMVALLPLLTTNMMLQQAVLNTVVSFITNEMRLQIID